MHCGVAYENVYSLARGHEYVHMPVTEIILPKYTHMIRWLSM